MRKKAIVEGNGGEPHQTATEDSGRVTTNQGVPVSDNQNSLKAGQTRCRR